MKIKIFLLPLVIIIAIIFLINGAEAQCILENNPCDVDDDKCCTGYACVGDVTGTGPDLCKETCGSLGGGCHNAASCGSDIELTPDWNCGSGWKCCKSSGIPGTTDCDNQPGYVKDCANCICYPDPSVTKQPGGNTTIYQLIVNTIYWVLGILAALGVLVIIIAGVQYIISAGDEKMVEAAKRNIKWAIIGLAVALSSLAIVRAISTIMNITTPSM